MKSTGIVRKIDELGRVVIPIELRRTLNLAERDPVEIFTDDDRIILKKYVSSEANTERLQSIVDLTAAIEKVPAEAVPAIENAIRLLRQQS